MTFTEGFLCISILAALIVPAWLLPRKLGILGTVLSHVIISLVTIIAIVFDFLRGVVPDPDFIWIIGNLCWMILANVALLPLTGFATFRHYRQKKKIIAETQPDS